MSTFAEIIGDAGDTQPSISEYLGSSEDVSESSETEVSAEETVSEEKTEETAEKPETPDQDAPEEIPAGEESAVADTSDKPEEAGEEITDEAIDKALADKRTGKWFRNSVEHLRGKISESETALQAYRELGTPEDLRSKITVDDPINNLFNGDGDEVVTNAALGLLKDKPDQAIRAINALVSAPNPAKPDQTIFDALLEDPEVQTYLKEQFQPAIDDPLLESIAPELREAYKRLSPEEKDDFRIASDAGRQKTLEREQKLLDIENRDRETAEAAERQKAEDERIRKEKDEADFNDTVNAAAVENFDLVTTQFSESLKQIPFAANPQINSFLQTTVETHVINACVFPGAPAGERAVAALKELGIDFPEDAPALVAELETQTRNLAEAKRTNDAQAIKDRSADIATVQRKLVGKANEVSGAIKKAFNGDAKRIADQQNDLFSPRTRPSVGGDGSNNRNEADHSHLSMREIVTLGAK